MFGGWTEGQHSWFRIWGHEGPHRVYGRRWRTKNRELSRAFELLGYKSKYFSFSVLEIKWKEEFPWKKKYLFFYCDKSKKWGQPEFLKVKEKALSYSRKKPSKLKAYLFSIQEWGFGEESVSVYSGREPRLLVLSSQAAGRSCSTLNYSQWLYAGMWSGVDFCYAARFFHRSLHITFNVVITL